MRSKVEDRVARVDEIKQERQFGTRVRSKLQDLARDQIVVEGSQATKDCINLN